MFSTYPVGIARKRPSKRRNAEAVGIRRMNVAPMRKWSHDFDPLTPDQWVRNCRVLTPELDLVVAVCADALDVLVHGRPRFRPKGSLYTPAAYYAAQEWWFGPSDPNLPFSLEWCCDHLGLTVEVVRYKLRRFKRRTRGRRAYRIVPLGTREAA